MASSAVLARGKCRGESNAFPRIKPRRLVPVSARSPIGRATKAYRGAGQFSSMNATPNNALQRTRVRPAGARSPLSFEPLGAIPRIIARARTWVIPTLALCLLSIGRLNGVPHPCSVTDSETACFAKLQLLRTGEAECPIHHVCLVQANVRKAYGLRATLPSSSLGRAYFNDLVRSARLLFPLAEPEYDGGCVVPSEPEFVTVWSCEECTRAKAWYFAQWPLLRPSR